MVRIRLKKYGRRHRPAYRLTAVDSRRTRNTVVIEELGCFDPLNPNPEQAIKLNQERIAYWLGVGAQPSETVRRILEKHGIREPKTRA
ncbi:MAG: 30S ribosomal protein S16 [Planctomycetota bacterium]